ncbi:MAG: hypothetical protein EOO02_12950 [Chitinophagaceae bacterium]|nr:MAG: hypothetical protein EOO02_12950 [Chitinophagaceae bacterium]
MLSTLLSTQVFSQAKLSVENVHATYLRNSGTIMERSAIKGYFFFYLSDKINRSTNEYTLQILDENVNKVIDIKFQDSKQLSLLEAAYNGSSLCFLFKNEETKTLDMKVYSIDGKLKYSYTREYDKRTEALMKQYQSVHTDEGTNQNVFDLGDKGYVSVLPVSEGKQRTYQVDYYSSTTKKQWTFNPQDEEKYSMAEYLGSTDSLIILQVFKKNRALSGAITSHLVGINFMTRKLAFDIPDDNGDEYKFVPTNITHLKEQGKIMVMGNYFQENAKIMKDHSEGIAIIEINTKGKTVSKKYNSWEMDFAKHLPVNSKGKVDNLGYLFVHKMIKKPDGKLFVVGEGYRRQVSAGGIALNALALAGGRTNAGVTKIVVTDMVMMEFDDKYNLKNASIYDKTNNTAEATAISDYNSQHAIALYLKMTGSFDYEFTTSEDDNSNFAVCFSDYVRSKEYKGKTFNSIRYNGQKFVTDKIELKSNASSMKVFPAKAGSVLILEYFKKAKKIEFRVERIG